MRNREHPIARGYRDVYKRQMGGNVDDHIKNFSFLMERNGTWHITPAYDMTFTTNLDGAVGLQHIYQQFHNTSWCIELSAFLAFSKCKLAQEILHSLHIMVRHALNILDALRVGFGEVTVNVSQGFENALSTPFSCGKGSSHSVIKYSISTCTRYLISANSEK